jgi:hypothetical protein
MRLCLTLIPVTPEYDRMAHPCFQDILACLGRTLRELGHDVAVSSEIWPAGVTPIILNYCVANAPGAVPDALTPPEGAIIYNQEAFDSPWSGMWQRTADAVRQRGLILWEMRAENIARWQSGYGIAARHVPFGYVPELVTVPHTEEKTIDVLFYGSLSPRRRAALAMMSSWGLRVHYHPHSPGAEREQLMGQAKVVLSLRFADGYQVESIRLIHALANECFVVCEEGPGVEAFQGGLVSADYGALTYVCADWSGRSELERAEVAQRGRRVAVGTQAEVREALVSAGF